MSSRYARLDELLMARERVRGELSVVAAETDPWVTGGRYFAKSTDASVVRGRTQERLMREADRLDRDIADETEFQYLGAVVPPSWPDEDEEYPTVEEELALVEYETVEMNHLLERAS